MDRSTSPRQRRVLLVDDHALYRRGLCRLLAERGTYTVVGEAASAYEALAQMDLHRPDLVLLDLHLPGVTGVQLTTVLKRRRNAPRVVMLARSADEGNVRAARTAGADAYITKRSTNKELLATLDRVCAQPRAAPARDAAALPLSTREVEILDCMVRGLSNREIAEALFISEQTVKNHMSRLFHKLHVRDRLQAVLFAIQHGWVNPGRPADRHPAA